VRSHAERGNEVAGNVVHDLTSYWPVLVAFVSLVAAGIGAPIPEELPVIGAGVWVGTNPDDLGPERWLILPVCIVGVVISDCLLYSIGRLWGQRLLQQRWLARLLPLEKRSHIEQNFQKYGIRILLYVRWLPGIRSPMFITAGTMRLDFRRFIIADGLSSMFGHSLLFVLGFLFGDQFMSLVREAEAEVNKVKPILILCGLGALAVYLLVHFLRRPVPTGDPKEELPMIAERVVATIETIESKLPLIGSKTTPAVDHRPHPIPPASEPQRSTSPPAEAPKPPGS